MVDISKKKIAAAIATIVIIVTVICELIVGPNLG